MPGCPDYSAVRRLVEGAFTASVKRLEGEASRASSAEAAAAGLRDQVTLLNETVAMLRGLLKPGVAATGAAEGTPDAKPKK